MHLIKEAVRLPVCEDNLADAELAEDRLFDIPGLNFELSPVGNPGDAVRLLNVSDCDATVIDPNLPDSLGLDTLRAVRATRASLPNIVLSGAISDDARLQTLR